MSFAKAEKLLDLATFAASRRQGVTLDDIIARYDISLRTAQRMLKALELRFPNAEFWCDDDGKKRCRLPGGQLRELFAVTANELSVKTSAAHAPSKSPQWRRAGRRGLLKYQIQISFPFERRLSGEYRITFLGVSSGPSTRGREGRLVSSTCGIIKSEGTR